MPVESATYISQLNATYPDGANVKSEGDNHLRLIKTVLQGQWPSLGAAAVTATAAEHNYLVGVTSAIQTQLNTKGAVAGQTWTGTHNFTGATVTVAEPSSGSHPVTKTYADGLAFSSALPSISSSTQDKAVTNNGTTARWDDLSLTAQSLFLASF